MSSMLEEMVKAVNLMTVLVLCRPEDEEQMRERFKDHPLVIFKSSPYVPEGQAFVCRHHLVP